LIELLQKYWWVIVLVALVGWSATLAYFTIWPPETAMEREVRLRAGFLEPKQAKDLDEAQELLETVAAHVRQLPRNQIEYLHIRRLLQEIRNSESSKFREGLLAELRKSRDDIKWKDVEDEWIQQTMSILTLGQEERPESLEKAGEKLEARGKEIEKENNHRFNRKLEDILDDLKHRETQNREDLLRRANEFLASEVVEMVKERLRLAGIMALPCLVRLLEEDTNENSRRHLYDVILHSMACARAQSLVSADVEQTMKDLRKEYGEEPDAAAVAKLRDWLNSPGNRELLGK